MFGFGKPKVAKAAGKIAFGGFGSPAAKARTAAVTAKTKPDMTGTSTQREKYGKAMASAFKNTKVFGMPGK